MADKDEPRDDKPGDDENQNPFEALFSSFGMGGTPGAGQPDLQQMMAQMQQMLSQLGMGGMFPMGGQSQGSGIAPPGANRAGGEQARWEQIRDLARRTVASHGADPSPTSQQSGAVRDMVRLADSWLDATTDFPATGGTVAAWSRAEWVENTMPTWRRLIDPVASSLSEAMAASVAPEGQDDEQLGGLEAMLRPWLRSSGAMVFGMQAGQAIGNLAASVVSATETGLPLSGDRSGTLALVPTNVAAFAEGLEQSDDDVLLFWCLRECARARLFHSVSWLGPAILNRVEQYARGITIDLSPLEEAITEIDPMSLNPESMSQLAEQLQGSLFAPRQTPEQKQVLEALETTLALVEGWVDEVVSQATSRWMPSATALAEAVRRRRATGGPTEAAFSALVGLELRPRRLRDAANLWAAVRDARGATERDALWHHPDLLPGASDLDDPIGYARSEPTARHDDDGDELDAELEKLLRQADAERSAGEQGSSGAEASGTDSAGRDSSGTDKPTDSSGTDSSEGDAGGEDPGRDR